MSKSGKVFDILLKSRYTPEGIQGALAGLKSVSEMGTFLRFGLVQPLENAGRAILDLIGAANPERVKRFTDSVGELKKGLGNLVDEALGPAIDGISEFIHQSTLLLNLKDNLSGVFGAIVEEGQAAGLSADELAKKIKGAIQAAQDAANKGGAGGNAVDFSGGYAHTIEKTVTPDQIANMEDYRGAIMKSSRSFEEYINALNTAGLKVKNLKTEILAFMAATGSENIGFGVRTAGGGGRMAQALSDTAIGRGKLLESIAVNESRRMEDLARADGRQLISINMQLTASLAQIDQSAADNRAKIEQDYQDRIKQIKRDTGQSIEDAIENRDARALAKALTNRSQQLGDNRQQHDRALADNDKAAAAQKAAAQAAAQAAIDAMKEHDRIAAEDARIAQARQLEDYKTSTTVLTSAGRERNEKELSVLEEGQRAITQQWTDFLAGISNATNDALRPGSSLLQAFTRVVQDQLGITLSGPSNPTQGYGSQ
jgi:hypothetical protein